MTHDLPWVGNNIPVFLILSLPDARKSNTAAGFYVKISSRRCAANYWDSTLGYRYYQAEKPVREQADAEGHAVRAMYLYSGMADVALRTGDEERAAACRLLWESATKRRMYITGGLGSSEYGEAFTFDYDLPNDTCYPETCAALWSIAWRKRTTVRICIPCILRGNLRSAGSGREAFWAAS